jgi:hypothetical protein
MDDGWMDGWMIGGWMNGWMDECMAMFCEDGSFSKLDVTLSKDILEAWFIVRFFSDSSKYMLLVPLSCKNKDGSIYCVNYM